MKCTLSDSLEWLYPDSSIAGEPVTALECDAPAGGVADVNILVTDAAPDAPLRYSSDAPDGEFFRLVDVPVERNTISQYSGALFTNVPEEPDDPGTPTNPTEPQDPVEPDDPTVPEDPGTPALPSNMFLVETDWATTNYYTF